MQALCSEADGLVLVPYLEGERTPNLPDATASLTGMTVGSTTRENLACFRQFVARHDGDFGARKGMTTERYYQTDVFAPKGGVVTDPADGSLPYLPDALKKKQENSANRATADPTASTVASCSR